MIVVAPLRLLPFPPKTTTTSSKPRFGYVVLLNKEVRWDFWPFASFYRNGKYRTTRSYNRQKQIFATSFGFGIYIYIDKETYFYRSTFILCFFLFTLYSNTEIHASKASKRLRLNSISGVNSRTIATSISGIAPIYAFLLRFCIFIDHLTSATRAPTNCYTRKVTL